MKFNIWEMLLATAMGIMIGCAIQWGPLDKPEEQPTAMKRETVPVGAVTLGSAGGVIVHRLPDRVFNNICYVTNAGELSCVNNQYNETTLK